MSTESMYARLGVDARKKGVEQLEKLIRNIAPYVFTSIVKDPATGEGVVLHVDGAGSKPIIAYLYHKETGDTVWYRGLAQDVVAMNLDDIVTVGARPIAFADYIALNPFRIPKFELLKDLSKGFEEVFKSLSEICSVYCPVFTGGETADLPDQVRTLDIVGVVYGKIKQDEDLKRGIASPGTLILGLRSGGRAKYEKSENSGIMCNGITLARHCLLSIEYFKKYPEVCEPSLKRKYFGRYRLDDVPEDLNMTVGEALLSPTRIYTCIIAEMVEKLQGHVKGMVHNTGGGLTKSLRLGSGLIYIKDNLPPPDAIFNLIQQEGRIAWREMYEVFNMGIGFEIMVEEEVAEEAISIAEKYGVEAYIIGRVEKGVPGQNKVIIKTDQGIFVYERKQGIA